MTYYALSNHMGLPVFLQTLLPFPRAVFFDVSWKFSFLPNSHLLLKLNSNHFYKISSVPLAPVRALILQE